MARQPKNPFDAILEQLVGNLVLTVNSMPVAGTVAGKVKLTKSEQQARYQAMRDDPQAWAQIVAQHGRDGAFSYWKKMEQQNATEKITGEPAGETETPGGG